MQVKTKPPGKRNGGINTLQKEDAPIHDWYRFVLSYPPHLVRQYMDKFVLTGNDLLFDPFCGTGTTLVEAKKRGVPSVGCDAHPFAALVSRVKTNWNCDCEALRKTSKKIIQQVDETNAESGLEALSLDAVLFHDSADITEGLQLTPEEQKLLPTGFLSARPLQRLLILRNEIEKRTDAESDIREFFLVVLAHVISNGAGNFSFGPEIYRTKSKPDYDVLGHFASRADSMIQNLERLQKIGANHTPSKVINADARFLKGIPNRVSGVITSPPYPNEKDYTRTTRVESILLRLVSDKADLRQMKESLLRSNTRNIFVKDNDGLEVKDLASVQRICSQIEKRRLELGKESGFERMYHKVVAHYFGGMRLHFRSLHSKLKKGANLAYVVGDQLSFLMVPIPTATILAEIAQTEGYEVTGCDLWRERIGTKVRNSITNEKTVRIREEILLLRCI